MFKSWIEDWRRHGALLAVAVMLGLLPTTGLVPESSRADATPAAPADSVPQAAGALPTPSAEWWKQLQEAPPEKWLEHYCAATAVMATKLCLVATAAGILGNADDVEARVDAVEARIASFQKELKAVGLLPEDFRVFFEESTPGDDGTPPDESTPGSDGATPDDDPVRTVGDPPQDRVPDPADSVLAMNQQPGPDSGPSSGTHAIEYDVPTVRSFPIDIKIGPDGALWFSMVTNNGVPGIGRVDPDTKATSMFALPVETGITYAVNGGPGPYMWWTSIPINGFGNKVGRIHVETHEVENWEIPTPVSYPADLKVGPDGAIWFTETRGGKIGRFDPDAHTFEEFVIPTPPVSMEDDPAGAKFLLTMPQDLAVIEDQGKPADLKCEGPAPEWENSPARWKDIYDGGACNSSGIWFSNWSPYSNSLGRIDPNTKEMTFYPYPTSSGLVLDISPGKDGRTVWYWYMGARYGGWFDPVTKVFTQYSTPTPQFLCCGGAGADKAMYWGESHMNTVGRYDLVTKEVTHIPVVTPRAIIIDFQLADGTIWIAEFLGNKIAEVVPDRRQELTDWPCGCAAPRDHPYNPNPIDYLLESTRAGGIAEPSAW